MLKSLEFENFKSWDGRHPLKFGRITGLFGANSSGKSSIIHLLLLLKQTAESADTTTVLDFGGEANDYVDCGSFVDIVSDHDISKNVSYSLSLAANRDTARSFFSNVHAVTLSNTIEAVPTDKGEEVAVKLLEYAIDCSLHGDSLIGDSYDGMAFETHSGFISGLLSVKSELQSSGEHSLNLSFDSAHLSASRHEPKSPAPIGLYRFHPEGIGSVSLDIVDDMVESVDTTRKITASNYTLEWAIEGAERYIRQSLRTIEYLGPLRNHPKRSYRWTGVRPGSVGIRGERAIEVLLAGKSTSVEAVSNWLRRLGMAESLTIERVGDRARIWEPRIQRRGQAARVNLVDVGFGVSQVLPVIVALLSASPGSLVILEHPDIHLHPRAQSELADLLIEVANAGEIQIIVESHSEHLLARIQRRIAESARGEGDLKLAREDVQLYFCKQEKGKSELEPLRIQSSGLITNWPDDFFGDILEERLALGGYYPDAGDAT